MDVEKTIQFLLEQQARFDAHQTELQAQFEERQAQFEERMTRIESILLDVTAAQQRTNAILETLTERHVELAQKLSEAQQVTQQNLNALSEAQQGTEQNLNALIDTLERHMASHK